MTAGNHNFVVQKGETWSALIAASDASSSHINHTGYTVEMDVREAYDSSSELLAFTVANSRVEIDGNGDISLSLAADITSSLSFDRGVYDLKVSTPGGSTSYYLRGHFIVQKTVTR